MYEYLKKLFGKTEAGEPEALTAEQLIKKIQEADAKELKVVNLADGGYVSIDKFNSSETELKGIKKQLETANATIQSYKDMDIEGIKKSATDWEEKYKTDTAALNQKIADQQLEFAEETYFSKYKFTDDFAKAGVRADFKKQGFKFDEKTGTFVGADNYMKGLMESHKAAFVIDDPNAGDGDKGGNGGDGDGSGSGNQNQNQPPKFLGGQGRGGSDAGKGNPFNMTFAGVRPRPDSK